MIEAAKLGDEARARAMFAASVKQTFRQCLQTCVDAMVRFGASVQCLLDGIDKDNVEKFKRVIDALKAQVVANQRQVAGSDLTDARKAIAAGMELMQNLPDPLKKEKLFLQYLKESKTDAATFTRQKKSLDKTRATLKSLGDDWQQTSRNWDDSADGTCAEMLKKCGDVAGDLESAVFIFALLSQLRTASVSQPGGAATRKKCLDLWATLRGRAELVCPQPIMDEAEQLLKSFGDSKAACLKIAGEDPVQAPASPGEDPGQAPASPKPSKPSNPSSMPKTPATPRAKAKAKSNPKEVAPKTNATGTKRKMDEVSQQLAAKGEEESIAVASKRGRGRGRGGRGRGSGGRTGGKAAATPVLRRSKVAKAKAARVVPEEDVTEDGYVIEDGVGSDDEEEDAIASEGVFLVEDCD